MVMMVVSSEANWTCLIGSKLLANVGVLRVGIRGEECSLITEVIVIRLVVARATD
jgi:hypothetical protein